MRDQQHHRHLLKKTMSGMMRTCRLKATAAAPMIGNKPPCQQASSCQSPQMCAFAPFMHHARLSEEANSCNELALSGRTCSMSKVLLQVRVKKAVYVKSSVNLSQCPKPKLPEFAVIGRSNVGKSSLINMLTGQGSLAKVSKTPGGPLSPATSCISLSELHALTNNEFAQ